jgi:hypothetical protein
MGKPLRKLSQRKSREEEDINKMDIREVGCYHVN